MDFVNDPEAQARYRTYAYCGFNYDTSTCWGYNTLRSTAPMVSTLEESLSFNVIDTTSWVRPTISKRTVGYTNLYFPVSQIQVLQIRLKLQRAEVNTGETISITYTGGTYNSSNGNPVFSTIKSFSKAEVNAIPHGEYVTLTVPLTNFKFPYDTMRGFNMNFNGMKDTTVSIDYIYFGSWDKIVSCKEGHGYTSKVTTAPTCTGTGVETFTCTVCSHSYTEAISAAGHTVVTDPGVAPTCTAPGKTEGKHCSVCNAVLTPQQTVSATGHSVVIIKGVAPTCTESGLTEGRYCSVCSEVLASQNVVLATGHSPIYTSKDDRFHIITCRNCSKSTEASHNYIDDLCFCGHQKAKDPMLETAWKIGHTLNLAGDISVNLAVSKSLLTGFDMDTVYILAEIDTYEGNTKNGTKTLKLLPEEQGSYYYFTLTGLTAVHMNDRIRSVLYGTKEGQIYYSATDDYSITDYAYSQMNKANMPHSLKTVCADLLRYGAKAQIFSYDKRKKLSLNL